MLTILAIFVFGCASVTPIPGGPEDTEPPEVLTGKSTPNFQRRFEKQPIRLTFNEWVELKDVAKQVIVSPPLEYPPDIRLKGKSVNFLFDQNEILRSDATYTINFGESVRDYTEGNPATNLRFVFSTGDQIDSLSVTGQVIDAFTGEPVPEVLVVLFDQLADTVIFIERPFYFSRTNAQGNFRIDNVKSGAFRAFGLIDNNFNYLYDLPGESLAFLDTPIVVSDSTPASLLFRLFKEGPSPRLLDTKVAGPGTIRLLFNTPASNVSVRALENAPEWKYQAIKDSLLIWHFSMDTTEWSAVISGEDGEFDTIPLISVPPSAEERPLVVTSNGLIRNSVPVGGVLALTFNRPVERIDDSKILLFQDSTLSDSPFGFSITGEVENSVQITQSWSDTSAYTLTLLPGAVSDFFGQTHDTINLAFGILPTEKLSSLSIRIDSFPQGEYVTQLLQKDKVIKTFTFNTAETVQSKNYSDLIPGSYSLRVIEDKNGNGKWDSGNLRKGRQPERIVDYSIDELRPNWELIKEVSWPKNNR